MEAMSGKADYGAVLKVLPDEINKLISCLSVEDLEILAYLISCPLEIQSSALHWNWSNPSSPLYVGISRVSTPSRAVNVINKQPALFNCSCFHCYTSYWGRWGSSPNHEKIDQALSLYEDYINNNIHHLEKKKKGEKNEGKGKGQQALEEKLKENDHGEAKEKEHKKWKQERQKSKRKEEKSKQERQNSKRKEEKSRHRLKQKEEAAAEKERKAKEKLKEKEAAAAEKEEKLKEKLKQKEAAATAVEKIGVGTSLSLENSAMNVEEEEGKNKRNLLGVSSATKMRNKAKSTKEAKGKASRIAPLVEESPMGNLSTSNEDSCSCVIQQDSSIVLGEKSIWNFVADRLWGKVPNRLWGVFG